jgi:hypothetical protein
MSKDTQPQGAPKAIKAGTMDIKYRKLTSLQTSSPAFNTMVENQEQGQNLHTTTKTQARAPLANEHYKR